MLPFPQRIFKTSDGDVPLYILGDISSKQKCLIMAGKHGDEVEGIEIIEQYLIPFLQENNCFDKCFFILPTLNPNQTTAVLLKIKKNEAKKYHALYQHRLNATGVNLNRDYPTNYSSVNILSYLQAEQTKIIIDLVERYHFNLILDLHTNGRADLNIYKYDEPVGCALAHKMSSISGIVARDYVNKKNKGVILPGTAGTYFGHERHIPILTIEFGRASYKQDFFEHCRFLWNLHKKAFKLLFSLDLKKETEGFMKKNKNSDQNKSKKE